MTIPEIYIPTLNEYTEISERFQSCVYKFPPESLEMLERSWHKLLIARVEGKIAGIITIQFHPNKPKTLSIGILQTYPDFLRKGIGTALLLGAEKIKTSDMTIAEGYLDNQFNLASANTFFRAGYHNHGFVDFTKSLQN